MPSPIGTWRPPRLAVASTKERHHYATAEWQARRQAILIRDAYTCRDCSRTVTGREAHVDHIVPLELGGTDAAENLAVRCVKCHGRKTMREQRGRGVL